MKGEVSTSTMVAIVVGVLVIAVIAAMMYLYIGKGREGSAGSRCIAEIEYWCAKKMRIQQAPASDITDANWESEAPTECKDKFTVDCNYCKRNQPNYSC